MSQGLTGYLSFYGAFVAVVRPIVLAAILLGLWLALGRAGVGATRRVQTWWANAIPLLAWFALVWVLAVNGAFEPMPGVGSPLIPLAVVLPVIIGLFLLMRSPTIANAVGAASPSWLIGLQVYRIIGGNFLALWAFGAIPGAFALPAGIGDMTVGLLALPVAFYLASGAPGGRTVAVAWNLLGIADLIVALSFGIMTVPGPLQTLAFDHPNLLVGTYPTVLTPAFAVPLSLILHGISLWQLRRLAHRPRQLSAATA
jgi:hypothetical protein